MGPGIDRRLLSFRAGWRGYEILYKGKTVGGGGYSPIVSRSDYRWTDEEEAAVVVGHALEAQEAVDRLVGGGGSEEILESIREMDEMGFFCGGCTWAGPPLHMRTAIPWFNSTMGMFVTAGFCPDCLPGAVQETRRLIARAVLDEPDPDAPRPEAGILEEFARFLDRYWEVGLRRDLQEFAARIRSAPSGVALSEIRRFLEMLATREIELPTGMRYVTPSVWNGAGVVLRGRTGEIERYVPSVRGTTDGTSVSSDARALPRPEETAGATKPVDDALALIRRFEARHFIWTVEDYRAHRPRPEDAEGEAFITKGPDGVEVTEIRDDSDIERFLPMLRPYDARERPGEAARNAFGRYLTLARERSHAEAVLSRLPAGGARSEEVARLAAALTRWVKTVEGWMGKEFDRLLDVARANPTAEAIDFMVDMYFSEDIFFGRRWDVLSALYQFPSDLWEERLLQGYAALSLRRAADETDFLRPLDELEHFTNKEALHSVVTRWIEELETIMRTDGVPEPSSSEERLLRAIFGSAICPLADPQAFLEELKAAARTLAEG